MQFGGLVFADTLKLTQSSGMEQLEDIGRRVDDEESKDAISDNDARWPVFVGLSPVSISTY